MGETNQELLNELEKRLSSFTEDEIMSLIKLVMFNLPYNYKEKLLQLDPQQANDWMKKSIQEIEQEKINKQVEEVKKFFDWDKNSEKK